MELKKLVMSEREMEMLNILIANTLDQSEIVLNQKKFIELWPNLNSKPPTEEEIVLFFDWLYSATKSN